MTLGSLLGLPLLRLCGRRRVLLTFSLAAAASLTAALFGPAAAARAAFPLVGLFAAVMWSILFSLALDAVPEHHGALSGLLVTGIVGGAVVPLLIGALADRAGLRAGMLVLYGTLGYVLSAALWGGRWPRPPAAPAR